MSQPTTDKPPPTGPVRIAIIGFAGSIGRVHTSHVLSSRSTRLVALVETSAEGRAAAAEIAPGVPVFRDVKSMLAATAKDRKGERQNGGDEGGGKLPDAAIVCTPTASHVAVALDLIRGVTGRGGGGVRYLLIEKPLADSTASARILLETARAHGATVLVGHHRRFNPYIAAIRKVLHPRLPRHLFRVVSTTVGGENTFKDSSTASAPRVKSVYLGTTNLGVDGPIGTVRAVSGLWTAFKPDGYFRNTPWRLRRSAGGGPITNNFAHEVDLLLHLLGPIVRVSAEKMPAIRRLGSDVGEGDAVEEGAALTLRFASGAVGSFVVSDSVVSPHFFEAATGEAHPVLPRAVRPHLHGYGEGEGPEDEEEETGKTGELCAVAAEPVDVYRFLGDNGTLSVPDMTLWTYEWDFPQEGAAVAPPNDWTRSFTVRRILPDDEDDPGCAFARQLDHLVAVVRGDVDAAEGPGCTGDEGLRVLAVCEALVAALDDGEGGKVVVDAA